MATDLHTLLKTKQIDNQFTQYFLYQIMVIIHHHPILQSSLLTWLQARFQICTFGRCRPSRSQAKQHPRQRKLRSQNLRLRISPGAGTTNDRLCLDEILSSTRDHAHVETIQRESRSLECWVHLCRNDDGSTAVLGEESYRPVLCHYTASGKSTR